MLTAKAEMLIRAPVAQAFEAFVDPAVTSKFWFSLASGELKVGGTVRWDWLPRMTRTLVEPISSK